MRIVPASLAAACLSGSWWSTDRWRWGRRAVSVYQSLQDFAILRSLNLSQNQANQEFANFCNCRRFSADFWFRRVPWRHRNVHSVKEKLFLSLKKVVFSSCPIYKSYIGQTNQKRNETALLVWAIQTVNLLWPETWAALDHATPLYRVLGLWEIQWRK